MKEAHQVHESARRGADYDGQDGLSEKLTDRLRLLEFRARRANRCTNFSLEKIPWSGKKLGVRAQEGGCAGRRYDRCSESWRDSGNG